jgi:hypothetical protein
MRRIDQSASAPSCAPIVVNTNRPPIVLLTGPYALASASDQGRQAEPLPGQPAPLRVRPVTLKACRGSGFGCPVCRPPLGLTCPTRSYNCCCLASRRSCAAMR